MEALIFHRNITKNLCPSEECDKFQVISLCSSSSKLFVYFQFQFQFQAQLVKTPQPVGFVGFIFSHMSYSSSKGALNCIRRVTLGKPQIGSMEALIFHRNITRNPLHFRVIRFVLFLVLVLICLLRYFQFQFQFQAQLVKNWPTRWDSLFLVMYRMLEVKKHSTTLLEELEWEKLRINVSINLPQKYYQNSQPFRRM